MSSQLPESFISQHSEFTKQIISAFSSEVNEKKQKKKTKQNNRNYSIYDKYW